MPAAPAPPGRRKACGIRGSTAQPPEARILAAAARLFREQGLAATGVDAVAAEAGVTSGAIYRAFGSKEKLFEAVVGDGVARLLGGIGQLGRAAPDAWPGALLDWYLGAPHVASPGRGCLLPTLTPDIARGGAAARETLDAGLRRAARLAAVAPDEAEVEEGSADPADAEAADVPPQGWALLSLLAGAVLLSRAVGPGPTQDEILAAAREAARALGPAA